jgi:hypothetical protein
MNNDEYFKQIEEYIKIHFQEKLLELENYRQLIWNTGKFAGYFGLVLSLIFLLMGIFDPEMDNFNFLYLIGICFVMVYYGPKPYRKRFKTEIVQPLFHAIFPGMSFYPDRFLEEKTIISSGILDIDFNENTTIHGEDLIITNIEGMPFEMSEVTIQENKSGVDLNFAKPSVFSGLLGVAELNFSANGGILHIVEKTKFRKYPELIKINLESPRLAEIYDFYSNDEVFARFILNPAVMDYLLDLYQRYNQKITLIVNDQKIFFSWKPTDNNKLSPAPVNLFDPKIYMKATNYDQILDIVKELLIILNIIRFIKINRQGWAKRF